MNQPIGVGGLDVGTKPSIEVVEDKKPAMLMVDNNAPKFEKVGNL